MNRGPLFLRTGAALVLAMTAACSFTVGFDGFVGSAETDAGGADADAETPVDGSSDAPVEDAGPEADAPDPNVAPIFVDGGSFCDDQTPGSVTLCDDFDTQPVTNQWSLEAQAGTIGRLTAFRPSSAPNCFFMDIAASTSDPNLAKLTHQFSEPSRNIDLAFDFKPEAFDTGSGTLLFAAVEWTQGAANDAGAVTPYSVRLLYKNGGKVGLEESRIVTGPDVTTHPTFTLKDVWTRIRLRIDLSVSPAVARLTTGNDQPVPGYEPVVLSPPANVDPRPTIILGGLFGRSAHSRWSFRYDNVAVTLR